MTALYSTFNIQPPTLYQVGLQLCNSKQELQKIEVGPSEGYEFENSQTHYARHYLGHPPIGFPGCFDECDPQNSALNNENNWQEPEFDITQYQSPLTPPSSPEAGWRWLHEADVQNLYDPQEKQPWGLPELSPYLQGVTDDESSTSSEPSSPSIPGGYPPVSPPQPPHEASYDSGNFGVYQSTSDANWGIQESDRYHPENSSSSTPRDTLPAQLLPSTDLNITPDCPTTHSNPQLPHNHRRAQKRNQQDIKRLKRRRSSTCADCDADFERPGDLQRHFDTAKAHGPANGPICPIGGCKYHNKRFTRLDNLKAHLLKIHELEAKDAGERIQRLREGRDHERYSPKAAKRGNGSWAGESGRG